MSYTTDFFLLQRHFILCNNCTNSHRMFPSQHITEYYGTMNSPGISTGGGLEAAGPVHAIAGQNKPGQYMVI